ncbi:hypothetical protein L1887_35483 [Cichorium endivia]|nr:hypothetical protein L1887_35483 [Cichorium endivia]
MVLGVSTASGVGKLFGTPFSVCHHLLEMERTETSTNQRSKNHNTTKPRANPPPFIPFSLSCYYPQLLIFSIHPRWLLA